MTQRKGVPDPKRVVIVVGPTCWGIGDSVKKAKANCRREAPSKGSCYFPRSGKLKFFAYSAPFGACVTDLGAIRYDPALGDLIELGEC